MTAPAWQAESVRQGGTRPFGWKFTTPLYVGAAPSPVNSSLIATMTARWVPCDPPAAGRRTIRQVTTRIDIAGVAGFGGP
jgi:hypothetical protein